MPLVNMKRCLAFGLCLVVPGIAFAGVSGSNFDGMAPGPYTGAGSVLEGNPAAVQVAPSGSETPVVPNGTGNVLVIDGRNELSRIVVEFTFDCLVLPNQQCVVKYDFSATNTFSGSWGFQVHVDAGGVYDNADDVWEPIGLESIFGDNTEGAGTCDGSTHTITFIVYPGTVLNIDNLNTQCIPPVPTAENLWSNIKQLYR